eukprot:PhM_4_TR11297/c0_g1_i1/m.93331
MNAMYCAEQINVPPELGPVLKQYTKAIIRDCPESVAKWSANYFAKLAGQPPIFDDVNGRLVTASGNAPTTAGSNGPAQDVSDVIVDADKFESLPTQGNNEIPDDVVDAVFARYDKNGNGMIDADELHLLIQDLIDTTGMAMGEDDVRQVLSLIDADEDGCINLAEFRHLFFQADESSM